MLENPERHTEAKMQLTARTSELMPEGKPSYILMRPYPMISALIVEHGRNTMVKVVFMLVKDFCASLNVVRNMSEDQMIEAAGFLLDECGNFRLEDYVMLFTLAKRGQLVKIMDRVDLSVMGEMLDAYWTKRDAAGKAEQERELKAIDNEINSKQVTFAPVIAEALTKWKEQAKEELEQEQAEKDKQFQENRDRSVAAFNVLMENAAKNIQTPEP